MDPVRQIRLLIAPFFFYFSLLTGILLSPCSAATFRLWLESFSPYGKSVDLVTVIVAVVSIVGVTALPIGFLISTLTIIIMRSILGPFKAAYYANLSEDDLDRIWPILRMDNTWRELSVKYQKNCFLFSLMPKNIRTRFSDKRLMVHVAIAFDHGILYNNSKGLHEWLMRTYTGYMASTTSAIALLLSCLVIRGLISFGKITSPQPFWWYSMALVWLILALGGLRAHRDALQMMEFLSQGRWPARKDS